MTFGEVLSAVFWLLILPIVSGLWVTGIRRLLSQRGSVGVPGALVGSFVFGQVSQWCIFAALAIPEIVDMRPFSDLVSKGRVAGLVFAGVSILLFAFLEFLNRSRKIERDTFVQSLDRRERICMWIGWGVFFLLLAVSLVLCVKLAYIDGDDAYFVSTATMTQSSDTMYLYSPYTSGWTLIELRHALAPFSIWLAFVAEHVGVASVVLAHVFIPMQMLLLAYGVYYLLGAELFGEKKQILPLFMILTEILFAFGNYSAYSPEKFLLTRSRQGKATLAAIILPLILYLFLRILKEVRKQRKVPVYLWCLMLFANMAGCLCSTMGVLLCVALEGVVAVVSMITFKKIRGLWPVVITWLPCVAVGVLYIVLPRISEYVMR